MARKSLIAPGSFLQEDAAATGADQPGILESIIRKDGQKYGRARADGTEDEALQVTNVTTLQRSKEQTKEETPADSNEQFNVRPNEEAKFAPLEPSVEQTGANETPVSHSDRANKPLASTEPTQPMERTDAAERAASPKADAERAARFGRALTIAREDEKADKIAVMTIRVPERLGAYMDRYVARLQQVQPKGRYRKQDAVAEAFAAFFADHLMPPEPAEEI